MIKTYCDICGKELKQDNSDQVNIDFNAFGISGFKVNLNGYECTCCEVNLCVECAESVVSDIEDLRMTRMKK
jgi:hypothetical protein